MCPRPEKFYVATATAVAHFHRPEITNVSTNPNTRPAPRPHPATALIRWFDSDFGCEDVARLREKPDRIEWLRCIPFVILHLGCLGVLVYGWSWIAVIGAVAFYFVRMFAITGFYHRYFSHRTFQTSRPVQFLFGLIGASAVQRGPLWWAAHHRHHHQHLSLIHI
jgi:stearoyl-CoA desaturase (delta-9 desaturase)